MWSFSEFLMFHGVLGMDRTKPNGTPLAFALQGTLKGKHGASGRATPLSLKKLWIKIPHQKHTRASASNYTEVVIEELNHEAGTSFGVGSSEVL